MMNVCLKLKCEGNSCKIEKVYGSKNCKEKEILLNGEIIKIDTLFASKPSKETRRAKGGVQLIKLKRNDIDNGAKDIKVELEVAFEDIPGKLYKNMKNV